MAKLTNAQAEGSRESPRSKEGVRTLDRKKSSKGARALRSQPHARDALLAAARTLFTEKGYEATSVVEITQLAGISVGSLYYHFANKAEIFLAMHEDYAQRQDKRVRDALHAVKSAGITDPRRLFLAGTRAYLAGVWEDRDVSRVLAEGETPSGFNAISRQWSDDWIKRNTVLLADGQPPAATNAIAAAVAGAVGAWAKDIVQLPDITSADEYIEQAVMVVGRMTGFDDESPAVNPG
ncbi:hypothetical protein GCM10009804_57920 [Kribbella hippodromi]|uniref:HTH tetR-type domain-containing protein n=1 Tax=Kribbella hippodromi TaxID=434347 RepID=A0ABP4PWW0_9ACTN